jgi:signal transduction histidine kinase
VNSAAKNVGRTNRVAWFALGLTWLVTVVLVVWGARALRAQVRAQMIGRDAVMLQAMAQAVRAADVDDLFGPDDPLWVLLRMEHLEGVLAARLFDAEGRFIASLPSSVRVGEVPEDAWKPLRGLQPVSRYHPAFDLSEILLEGMQGDLTAPEEKIAAVEVLVPFQRRSDRQIDAIAWFFIDGRGIAEEFARLDRNLTLRAAVVLGAALGLTGLPLGLAFRRLARTNRLLARRTDDLQRANLELSQSARVAALGAVTAHLMHGLKNPVSGLHSFVASRAELGAPGEEAWVEALSATRRMQGLIQQVVRVLHDQGAELEYEMDLREVAEAVLKRARAQADEAGVRLVLTSDGSSTMIDNRAGSLLTLLLSNLVENGIEATPPGGAVHLRLSAREGAACEVADGGPGLAPAVRARLFQPQRSTKEGGSGLGLAISHQLALALGGSIRLVASGPGGTVFRVEVSGSAPGAGIGVACPHTIAEHG